MLGGNILYYVRKTRSISNSNNISFTTCCFNKYACLFLLRSTKPVPYCLGIAIDRERWEINQLDFILNFLRAI